MPNFLINLVTYTKLKAKNVYINGRNRRLKRNNKTFYLLKKYRGHSLLKNNTATNTITELTFIKNSS